MLQKVSYALCLGAWLATWVIGFIGLAWPLSSGGDIAAILFTALPYIVLAGLTWWFRKTRWASGGVLALAFLIAGIGIYRFASAWHRYHSRERSVAELSVVLTPLIQLLLIAFVFGAILLWHRYKTKKGKDGSRAPEAKSPETSETASNNEPGLQ